MAAAGPLSSLRGAPCRSLLTLLVSGSLREPPGPGWGRAWVPAGGAVRGKADWKVMSAAGLHLGGRNEPRFGLVALKIENELWKDDPDILFCLGRQVGLIKLRVAASLRSSERRHQ